MGTTSPRLRDSALSACAALAHVVASSKDALAAAFVATGRLESLEAALLSLLRASSRGAAAARPRHWQMALPKRQKRAATETVASHHDSSTCSSTRMTKLSKIQRRGNLPSKGGLRRLSIAPFTGNRRARSARGQFKNS